MKRSIEKIERRRKDFKEYAGDLLIDDMTPLPGFQYSSTVDFYYEVVQRRAATWESKHSSKRQQARKTRLETVRRRRITDW
jgi:hypothetical protein